MVAATDIGFARMQVSNVVGLNDRDCVLTITRAEP
jgi:hypothetical protein